ncbi:hypothetical protein [Rhodococcus sp. W8901]|uniref:hypothetical protein n=1 Tax=Rhodococcus sp. W8901 TaxID=2742603 RepID=UPI001581C56C|nr:hypothetical protein [Rhodococcus sp. W8901]QKT10426.1 hypothetical protein HUN07_06575 [Rhodococcus sp. W8901]
MTVEEEVDGARALELWRASIKGGPPLPDGPGWGDVSHEDAALDWWRTKEAKERALPMWVGGNAM